MIPNDHIVVTNDPDTEVIYNMVVAGVKVPISSCGDRPGVEGGGAGSGGGGTGSGGGGAGSGGGGSGTSGGKCGYGREGKSSMASRSDQGGSADRIFGGSLVEPLQFPWFGAFATVDGAVFR